MAGPSTPTPAPRHHAHLQDDDIEMESLMLFTTPEAVHLRPGFSSPPFPPLQPPSTVHDFGDPQRTSWPLTPPRVSAPTQNGSSSTGPHPKPPRQSQPQHHAQAQQILRPRIYPAQIPQVPRAQQRGGWRRKFKAWRERHLRAMVWGLVAVLIAACVGVAVWMLVLRPNGGGSKGDGDEDEGGLGGV